MMFFHVHIHSLAVFAGIKVTFRGRNHHWLPLSWLWMWNRKGVWLRFTLLCSCLQIWPLPAAC